MKNLVILFSAGLFLTVMLFPLSAVKAQDNKQGPAIPKESSASEGILDIQTGKVLTVDLTGNKLSITDTKGEKQNFVLDPNLTTVWDDTTDEEKELSDLKVGTDVVVEFKLDNDGKKTASWIDLVVRAKKEENVQAKPAVSVKEPAPIVNK